MRRKHAGKPGFIVIVAAVFLLAACASVPPNQQTDQNESTAASIAETPPPERPRWISQLPESTEFLYFTGMAEADSESEARSAAVRDGFTEASAFYGNLIQSEIVDHSVFIEDMGKTIAESTTWDDKTNSYTNAVISDLRAVEYYTETLRARNTRLSYKVWVLCRVPRQKAEEDRANFAKNISGRYTSLLDAPYPTLSAAIHSYSAVLSALEQNPLHRAVAYYDGPGGRVGLYDYCGVQLGSVAGSISFDSLPSAAIEKGDTLDAAVKVLAPLSAAGLDCSVKIYGMNNPFPTYTVGADSSFQLKIFSSRLEPGSYTVQLELLLNRIDPLIRRNPVGNFNFVVQPLSAVVDFNITGSGVGDPEKTVLVQGIQQGIEHYGVPVNLKPEGPAGGAFTVTLNLRTQDPAGPVNRSLVICDTVIAFSRDGATLETASRRISEIDAPNAVNQVRKFIAENQEFFRNISVKLSQ